MADTQRSKTDLTTNLFQDGQTAGISAQDMRDLIESMHWAFGGVYMNLGAAAATTINTQSVFETANWNSIGTASSTHRFTASTAGALTYTGTPDVHAHIACTISFSCAVAAAKEIEWRISINGTPAAGSAVIVDTDGNTTTQSTALHWDVTLSTNDVITLEVANNTDTTDVTLEACYLFATCMFV